MIKTDQTSLCEGQGNAGKVERRFTRMVPGLRGLEYGERLERLGLLTLEARRNRLDLVEMFKISRGLSAIPWDSFFRAGSSEKTREHSKKLAKESFKLEVRKTFLTEWSTTGMS